MTDPKISGYDDLYFVAVTMADTSIKNLNILRYEDTHTSPAEDFIAIEEPLEIQVATRVDGLSLHQPVAVTMRTPGHDFELAAGFLFSEDILQSPAQIDQITRPTLDADSRSNDTDLICNVAQVHFSPGLTFDLTQLSRHVFTSSSCGICGRQTIEQVKDKGLAPLAAGPEISAQNLCILPQQLERAQSVFNLTGGLHAAALFDSQGKCLIVREDVGRHNALDKLVGSYLLAGHLPVDSILMLSGRASFELVQKAARAGISFIASIGPPSSLAVELAKELGMTLVGFLKRNRFNIYCGEQRLSRTGGDGK